MVTTCMLSLYQHVINSIVSIHCLAICKASNQLVNLPQQSNQLLLRAKANWQQTIEFIRLVWRLLSLLQLAAFALPANLQSNDGYMVAAIHYIHSKPTFLFVAIVPFVDLLLLQFHSSFISPIGWWPPAKQSIAELRNQMAEIMIEWVILLPCLLFVLFNCCCQLHAMANNENVGYVAAANMHSIPFHEEARQLSNYLIFAAADEWNEWFCMIGAKKQNTQFVGFFLCWVAPPTYNQPMIELHLLLANCKFNIADTQQANHTPTKEPFNQSLPIPFRHSMINLLLCFHFIRKFNHWRN